MKTASFCIIGAGSIGLDLGWNLINAGYSVTFVARDRTFTALKKHGLRHADFPSNPIPPDAFTLMTSAEAKGVHDYVFLTTKANDLSEASQIVPRLISENSCLISATNGIPPWYSYLQETTIGRFSFPLEPRENFLAQVPGAQLLGAIVERSSELQESGMLRRSGGKGFTIGEPDHHLSKRCEDLQTLLQAANFTTTVSDNIHRDIWLKLIGNVAVNPLSVLTERTIGEMLNDPAILNRMQHVIQETEQVGLRLGVIQQGDFNADKFFTFMRDKLGHHHTSMFQDFRNGKPLELHRIVDVVEMLAKAAGPERAVAVPAIIGLRRELEQKLQPANNLSKLDGPG